MKCSDKRNLIFNTFDIFYFFIFIFFTNVLYHAGFVSSSCFFFVFVFFSAAFECSAGPIGC